MEAQVKKPIKEVKDIVVMVARGVSVGIEAYADKKIDFNDMGLLLKFFPTVPPAIENIAQFPEQLADMDEAEAGELVAAIAGEFAIADEAAKNLIEVSFQAIAINIKLVNAIKGVIKKPAA